MGCAEASSRQVMRGWSVPPCGQTACVVGQFGNLYRAKDVAVPQLRESTWRCMICSDLCAVCVPAARIGCKYPFYRCGSCGAKAHQHHWRAGDHHKLCFYCRLPMCMTIVFLKKCFFYYSRFYTGGLTLRSLIVFHLIL